MEIKYPQTILRKSTGITDSEKYLAKLCHDSFLSMWSYPNIYRDDGKKKEGKEICDLLVIFENHIIIFSDKKCAFPNSGNIQLDWSRWYRKTVRESSNQILGAERWILNYPERIFLDKTCLQKLPLSIPAASKINFHRIVVAHAASTECISQLGGSGSLMIVPGIIGDMHYADNCFPFAIGQVNPSKGFFHVFDDTSLQILMETLDTITDFVEYLEKKEIFINSGKLISAAGEEELLACYLQKTDSDGKHNFIIKPEITGVTISEGYWEKFLNHPQRIAQIKANEISYSWDMLIEKFLRNLFAGTSHFLSHENIAEQEKGFRFLARENRTRRRLLSEALNGLIAKTQPDTRATRTVLPSHNGDPYYIFLLLPKTDDIEYKQYRTIRRNLLFKYCSIIKLKFPEAIDIIGIATESGLDSKRSEDFGYLDARKWTEADLKKAKETESELMEHGLFGKQNKIEKTYQEYPEVEIMKGSCRNKPCPCGSGKKYKKCCGS